MSYQVLARKWRPRKFADLVGQQHVVRALSNALDRDRLHHAYLFTGTRGVGKTTIARIFARALNCETGVSATPCGTCGACTEIDDGRFVDLIEVDAASRTGVDDTRELLENVQYAPSRGRYKVYLIDEVHMFSRNSFNALLKTLEEPPPHVKFLLATTDPKKLPVTILSRCLQFNLRRLAIEEIEQQLGRVLQAESIPGDAGALRLLADAADGSLRDALSLLDQAIAYGGGRLAEAEVAAMLGTIDRGQVHDLLDRLVEGDGPGMLERIAAMAEAACDFQAALGEVAAALQRVAVRQIVGGARAADDEPRIDGFAGRMGAEDCQLWYQIALLA
ncbi:MAG: DNA polymerase III subunit gamma/tau, partial [Gammaproteobacteria bacterium]